MQALGLRPNQGGGLEERTNLGSGMSACLSRQASLHIDPKFGAPQMLTPQGAADRARNLRACTAPRKREIEGKTSSRHEEPALHRETAMFKREPMQ